MRSIPRFSGVSNNLTSGALYTCNAYYMCFRTFLNYLSKLKYVVHTGSSCSKSTLFLHITHLSFNSAIKPSTELITLNPDYYNPPHSFSCIELELDYQDLKFCGNSSNLIISILKYSLIVPIKYLIQF